jgi:hypothetical protein
MSTFILIIVIFFLFLMLLRIFSNPQKNSSNFRKKYKHLSQNSSDYQSKYKNVSDIANHFSISTAELNKIFEQLDWAIKSGAWWIATERGKSYGAKEEYNKNTKLKYLRWDMRITYNKELIDTINIYKSKSSTENYLLAEKKKQKGDRYEEYVASYFRSIDYYVWEHGKEKGVRDGGIDLFIKRGEEAFFVQCKNWETWKVDDKTIKATQTDVRNYMYQNPILTKLLNGKKKKILYVTSKECLTKGAYRYIKENREIIEYQVIPMA